MKASIQILAKPLILGIALGLCVLSAQAEQVYKWVDENGTIHYSDMKPNNVNAENVRVKTGKSSGSRSSPQSQAQEMSAQQEQALQKKADELQTQAKARENDAQCQLVRDNLKKLQENSRVKVSGEDGEFRYLTPEEINAKKAEYREMLQNFCN